MKELFSLAIAILTITRCFAENILFLVYPTYSHFTGPANVGKFLRSQGHKVVVTAPTQLKDKLKDHGVNLLLYRCLGEYPEERLLQNLIFKEYFATLSSILQHIQMFLRGNQGLELLKNIGMKILKDAMLFEDIQDFNPDLIVLDSSPLAVMLTLIPYKLNTPFIMMGSVELAQYIRAPIIPTADPHFFLPYTDQMTFLQRLSNTIAHVLAYRINPLINPSVVSEYIADKPYISPIDLQAKAQLWIIRQHSVLGYNPPWKFHVY